MTRLLIAGGGTGGHVFPGVAVAEALKEVDPTAEILFVGTAPSFESRHLPKLGWTLKTITIYGIKNKKLKDVIKTLFCIPWSCVQSLRILRSFRPDVVLGLGGYASAPVLLVARLLGIRTAILEPNTTAGLANRWLSKIINTVFLAYAEAKHFFPKNTVHITGIPLRQSICNLAQKPAHPHDPTTAFNILIIGGSQGAEAINHAVVDALQQLQSQTSITVTHQTGAKNLEQTRSKYNQHANNPSIQTLETVAFIDDMSAAYHAADLIICRAGAITLCELPLAKCPAIVIPYPYATDNHQQRNAEALQNQGAIIMLLEKNLIPESLATIIDDLIEHPHKRQTLATKLSQQFSEKAASRIVDWCQL